LNYNIVQIHQLFNKLKNKIFAYNNDITEYIRKKYQANTHHYLVLIINGEVSNFRGILSEILL